MNTSPSNFSPASSSQPCWRSSASISRRAYVARRSDKGRPSLNFPTRGRATLADVRHLLIVALVCSLAGCGKDSPTAPSPTPTGRFTLTGTVTDGSTPLAGASVLITDGPNANRSATTSSAGVYSLTNLERGGFTLRVSLSGYDDQNVGLTLTADAIQNVTLARTAISWAGAWGGLLSFRTDGTVNPPIGVSLTLAQDGLHITGPEFRALGNILRLTGDVTSLLPDARFVGQLMIDSPSSDPAVRCRGTADVSGPAYPVMRLTAPVFVLTNCTGAVTEVALTLNR